MMQLLIEAISVGAMLAPVLLAVWMVIKPTTPQAILLMGFVIGLLFHLVCEWVGINRWYCKYGHACI